MGKKIETWASYQRKLLIEYLEMKVVDADWHGVADAAMDLRELEARHPELKQEVP